ncbi:hypothetical protein BS17DRAFT_817284 [Gyrodon lividus]|nr:hypothetical protein BS17DRAFT_817284 [Gyrodon lividus]
MRTGEVPVTQRVPPQSLSASDDDWQMMFNVLGILLVIAFAAMSPSPRLCKVAQEVALWSPDLPSFYALVLLSQQGFKTTSSTELLCSAVGAAILGSTTALCSLIVLTAKCIW